MSNQVTVNTNLEQKLYSGSQRERSLRSRATLAIFLPLFAGLGWATYAALQLHSTQDKLEKIQAHVASTDAREAALKSEAEKALAALRETEAKLATALENERRTRAQMQGVAQSSAALSQDVEALKAAVAELSTLRTRLSLMNNSEPAEALLGTIRSNINRQLNALTARLGQNTATR